MKFLLVYYVSMSVISLVCFFILLSRGVALKKSRKFECKKSSLNKLTATISVIIITLLPVVRLAFIISALFLTDDQLVYSLTH